MQCRNSRCFACVLKRQQPAPKFEDESQLPSHQARVIRTAGVSCWLCQGGRGHPTGCSLLGVQLYVRSMDELSTNCPRPGKRLGGVYVLQWTPCAKSPRGGINRLPEIPAWVAGTDAPSLTSTIGGSIEAQRATCATSLQWRGESCPCPVATVDRVGHHATCACLLRLHLKNCLGISWSCKAVPSSSLCITASPCANSRNLQRVG